MSKVGHCFSKLRVRFSYRTSLLVLKAKRLAEEGIRELVKGTRGQRGATVAEYALVLAIVVVGLILVLGQLGETLREKILDVVDRLKDAPTSP
ncbi:MAG TPA: Flp family type IVb pilin [Firmicutes bacterium]|nr:Flp family type IVb pilin [Candidatus Fermentithermobacillaceae bacterium]